MRNQSASREVVVKKKKRETDASKFPEEDEEEMQEVNTSPANAKEKYSYQIWTAFPHEKKNKGAFLGGRPAFILLPTVFLQEFI